LPASSFGLVWQAGGDAIMKLVSKAFTQGKRIPALYTGDGRNISPPLEWTGTPEGTAAFALSVEDLDAPGGIWVHWLMYDLPGTMCTLPEAVDPSSIVFSSAKQGRNDFGNFGYGGPEPPPSAEHRYVFSLLALDACTGLDPGADLKDFRKATAGHILASARLMGKYKRQSSGHP
jgi:Raf kinase inhibitor-like YbhB/YbcL family protein